MLTRLKVRNFKCFEDVDVELGRPVVFVGPNNSGKTSALQALALWDVGLRSWNAKRGNKASPQKRPGVVINRRDLISIPIPAAKLLWRDLHVRRARKTDGKTKTRNIRIDITVEGESNGAAWSCGLEFDYVNEESLVCRPLRLPGSEDLRVEDVTFSEIPDQAGGVRVAFLPPMSSLAAEEPKWEPGRIDVLLGQGQTVQVLRNLCHLIYEQLEDNHWEEMVDQIDRLFGVRLRPPVHVPQRGEITMEYKESGTRLDLSCAGRGLLQTLLLLAHLYANPTTALLLDEPDAHLEVFRQRQTFGLITEVAESQGSQIIAASHSEVVLGEAAQRGTVVAFVGKPHTLNDRPSQVMKALTEIGWDQYYLAEAAGWVLYLEGATDLAILQALAEVLEHPASEHLDRPFVHYVSANQPQRARDHFYGLREGKPDLQGIAIFDRLDVQLQSESWLRMLTWSRKELENYFCTEDVLLAYAREARESQGETLFAQARELAMRESIQEVVDAIETIGKDVPWSRDIKASDDFLDAVFRAFFKKLRLPLLLRKCDYHGLARLMPKDQIDPEVTEKLDAIVAVAEAATPPAA